MTIYKIRQKEVINCRDGQKLGYICDVEIDLKCYTVTAFIIPGPCKICGIIGRDKEYVIPIRCVKQIGEDVVLVDVDLEKIVRKCK